MPFLQNAGDRRKCIVAIRCSWPPAESGTDMLEIRNPFPDPNPSSEPGERPGSELGSQRRHWLPTVFLITFNHTNRSGRWNPPVAYCMECQSRHSRHAVRPSIPWLPSHENLTPSQASFDFAACACGGNAMLGQWVQSKYCSNTRDKKTNEQLSCWEPRGA
jgi:hypothetical protein